MNLWLAIEHMCIANLYTKVAIFQSYIPFYIYSARDFGFTLRCLHAVISGMQTYSYSYTMPHCYMEGNPVRFSSTRNMTIYVELVTCMGFKPVNDDNDMLESWNTTEQYT